MKVTSNINSGVHFAMMGSGTLDGKPEYRGVAGEGAIVN